MISARQYNELQARFDALHTLRHPLQHINEDTLVLTYCDCLEHAVVHYQVQLHLRQKLPTFILLDCIRPEELSAKTALIIEENDLCVLFLDALHQNPTEKFCVYVTPAQHPITFMNIFCQLRAHGIMGCAYDAVCTSRFFSYRLHCPHYYTQEILYIYSKLEDEESREIFLRAIKARSTQDADYLMISPYRQYDHPDVQVQQGDVVVEGGIFDGLSTERFAQQTGPNGKIIAFEAFPEFAKSSELHLSEYPWVLVEPLGLYSTDKTFYMCNNTSGSYLQENYAENAQEVHTIALDSYFSDRNLHCCDLLKLDIEGAEMECLKGALHMLNECKPKLHISLYHNAQHYFSIPIFLMNHFPDYKYYMGHSSAWYNETVLYATPPAPASKKSTYMPEEHADNLCATHLAAGKKFVFVGCGASYKRHKAAFSACTPVAFAVDEYYQASLPSMIDGIPVKNFAALTADERQLPVILFSRREHEFQLLEKIEKHFPGAVPINIIKCIVE